MSPNVIKLKDMFSRTVGNVNWKLMLLFNQQKIAHNDIRVSLTNDECYKIISAAAFH